MGSETLVRVVKNKLAPPFKEAKFEILYGKGIAKERDLLNVCAQLGIVKRMGAWLEYGEQQLGQGISNAAEALIADPQLAERLSLEIREKIGLVNPETEPEETNNTDEAA